MKKIYFDHAASTPVDSRALKAMQPFFSQKFGNASSLHAFGQEAKTALEKSREKIARLIGARKEEIIFTSSGTESNNLALQGIARALKDKGKHLIVSAIEHPCIMNTAKFLQSQGFKVDFLPVDKFGLVEPKKVEELISGETILVSVMHANHEVGSIQPVQEIGQICQSRGIYFHSDAAQSFGKIPVNVKDLKVDLMTLSSHKIYGPKGVAALFVKEGTRIEPLLYGGGHEFGLRSSTENIAGIVGFAAAAEIAVKNLPREMKRLSALRDKLIQGVMNKISDVKLNGHPKKRLPNNAHFSFKFIEGEALLVLLDSKGIAVSTGSACSSKALEPSHILTAMDLSPVQAHGSLRISLGRENTSKEIDYFLKVLPPAVKKLRKISVLKSG